MYCIMPEQKCPCVALKMKNHIILARNSDFLTEIEKLYMNCIIKSKKPGVWPLIPSREYHCFCRDGGRSE